MATKTDNASTFKIVTGVSAVLLLIAAAFVYLQSGSGGSSRNNREYEIESPEPYATTDIFRRSASGDLRGRQQPINLADLLPPPPSHPPPALPPSYLSQESVISPKYLFSHPVYQATTTHYQRVYPRKTASNPAPSSSSVESESAESRLLPDRELANELQIFNEAVTRLRRPRDLALDEGDVEGAEEMMMSACEADREDN